MPAYSPVEWTLIFTAAFGDGFLIRTFGSGVGITLTPLLTLAFTPRFSLGLLAFYSTLASVGMARSVWTRWDRRTIFLVLPGQVAGLLLGTWLITRLPDAELRWIIGLLCLVFALHRTFVEVSGHAPRPARIPLWLGTMMGGLSGFTSAVANAGATVMTLFLHAQSFSKAVLLATLWALFFILNPIKLAAYWQAGILGVPTLLTGLAGLPLLWAGLRLGAWAHERLPGRAFNLMILAIALAGSLRLLLG